MSAKPTLPLRPCVGVVVFNNQGKVWIGRRAGSLEHSGSAKLWQLPQGGIDKGEAPDVAARRELFEETNITSADLLAEAPEWFDYELPPELVGIALKGKYRGQTQKWFAYRFTGNDSEIAIDAPQPDQTVEFDAWRWENLERLPDLVVDFKRPVYERVVKAFTEFAGS